MSIETQRRFKFDLLAPAPQLTFGEQCEETEEDAVTNAQYEIEDVRNIWYRVLCVNRVPGKRFPNSLLGPTGHLERCNVVTHLFAAVIYFVHVVARVIVYGDGQKESLSNTLVTVDSISLIFTYVLSAAYHVYSANRFWSAAMRIWDYFGIYASISASYVADLSVATINLRGLPNQAVMDVVVASVLLTAFFAARRMTLPINETRHLYFREKCSLGLARSTNVDLQHSSLRASGGLVLAFSWILTMPLAVGNLEAGTSTVFVWSHIAATLVLLIGMLLDNAIMFPEEWLHNNASTRSCVCYSKKEGKGGGYILNSHALWHIVALVSTILTTAALEYVIANSEKLYSENLSLTASQRYE